MCRFTWDEFFPDCLQTSPQSPFPLLTWGVPVDIVQLSSSLEAFASLRDTFSLIRLSHRFRSGLWSRLPQEIFEQILCEVHRQATDKIRATREIEFACFQNRCRPEQHFLPGFEQTAFVFSEFVHPFLGRKEARKSYTKHEKAQMVQNLIANDPELYYENELWEWHDEMRETWIKRFCVCEKKIATMADNFYGFDKVSEPLYKCEKVSDL